MGSSIKDGISAEFNHLKTGTQLAAIAITPAPQGGPTDFWSNYEQALDLALSTGIDLPGELTFYWSRIEQRNIFGQISYQDEMTTQLIKLLKRKQLPVVITIAPFETMNSRIPKDLVSLSYDDPKTLERFKHFIDWVYQQTEGLEAVALVFGNEFDLHVTMASVAEKNRWAQLDHMVNQTKQYLKSLDRWKNVPFALETTYSGLTDDLTKNKMLKLNRHADIIGVSYYPLAENVVLEPSIIKQQLYEILSLYPDKKIDFYQYGYPSSKKINGSLEKQRQFIENTFNLWDKYNDRIRMITFTWLYDLQQAHIKNESVNTLGALKPDQAFLAFIGSLGLLGRNVGEEKPAFIELKKQLKQRKWQ